MQILSCPYCKKYSAMVSDKTAVHLCPLCGKVLNSGQPQERKERNFANEDQKDT